MHASEASKQTADSKIFDLNGYWLGEFGANGYELVFVEQEGMSVLASKVTGDVHVPGGQTNFEVELEPDGTGKGRIQLADRGFQHPRWSDGHLKCYDEKTFRFFWSGAPPPTGRIFHKVSIQGQNNPKNSRYFFSVDEIAFDPSGSVKVPVL